MTTIVYVLRSSLLTLVMVILFVTPAVTAQGTEVPFDFDFSIPSIAAVRQGVTTGFDIIVDLVSGSSVPVTLSSSGLPPGSLLFFSPGSGNPPFTSSVFIATTQDARPGIYQFQITATGGNLSKSVVSQFQITPRSTIPTFQFSLSTSQSIIHLFQGDIAHTTVSSTLMRGTSEPITLSLVGLPPGASFSISPAIGNPTFNSTLEINVPPTAPSNTYTVTIVGTASESDFSETTNIQLNILPTPPTPPTSTIEQSTSSNFLGLTIAAIITGTATVVAAIILSLRRR